MGGSGDAICVTEIRNGYPRDMAPSFVTQLSLYVPTLQLPRGKWPFHPSWPSDPADASPEAAQGQ